MSEHDLNWKYVDEAVNEPATIQAARQVSLELGVTPVSPGVGAQLAVLAAAHRAKSIVEIGTGVGVSGLWLLSAVPHATLTTIDADADMHQHARGQFTAAGITTARARLITDRAATVLPRMNEQSYDLVFIDADADSIIEYVEHALRLAKVGGVVVVARALATGRVADPARRDEATVTMRGLIDDLAQSPAVATAITPVGDGLLQIVKLAE
ncbi:MAG TPA: class I SAM-dependent methyltransferase [Candidatus Lumbricidophila sp.]|nr:class I SAM-dependent methyltransferase [Candidatus Lumbricidophila sp.]